MVPQARTSNSPGQSQFEFWPGKGSIALGWRPKTAPRDGLRHRFPCQKYSAWPAAVSTNLKTDIARQTEPNSAGMGTSDSIKSDTASPVTLTPIAAILVLRKERRPLRQHRQHRLRPYRTSAGGLSRRLSSQAALAQPEECCSEPGPGPARTLLTVLTVFPSELRILITLLPARPSRLKVISMPSARRNVCALRRWPARARGFLGQPV